MPLPTTAPELVELVRKSGVVEPKRLDAYLEQLTAAGAMPAEPAKLAGLMVRDGVVTHFQAEQFMMGKWRRFTIGKYKVLERLGSGGMGSVFLCEHKLMRRRVAVKVLPTAKAEDPAALERFYREARAVAQLDHPNIVRAYDIDQDDKLHFLVMEHIDGSNLQEIVKKTGPLDPVRAAHYIRQSALGLQHAHEAAGLVHRDIKPGNILVDRNGIVKVLDMGLARFFHEEEDSITRKYDESVLGTADYLAPEQAINSHDVDIRADIYSLGATLYFCLTGKTPFHEGSIAQKLIWHQTRQPKSVKLLRPEVPDGIVAVIDRAMAKDPNQRFATPQAMAESLSPWTQTPIAPPAAIEMPQLSRAAMGFGPGDPGSGGPQSSGGSASPSPRKTWLVPGAGPSSAVTGTEPAPPAPSPGATTPAVTAPVVEPPSSPSPTRETRTDTSSRGEPAGTAAVALPAGSIPIPVPRPVIKTTTPPPAAAAKRQVAAPSVVEDATAEEEERPPWEELAGDTENLTSRVDTAPTKHRKSGALSRDKLASTGQKLAATREKLVALLQPYAKEKWFWWAVGGAAAGLVLLIALVWWALSPSQPRAAAPAAPTREPLAVFATDKGGAGESLKAKLRAAKNGEIIQIYDDISADLNTGICNAKNVTIEGYPGRTIVWRCPSGDVSKLLTLTNAAGFKIRNLTFDGEDKLDSLVTLFGDSAGLTLENVTFRGFRRHAIWVINCAGSPEHPVTLTGLQFGTAKADQSALYFDINTSISGISKNEYMAVLRDCSFSGPGAKVRARQPGLFSHVEFPDDTFARGQ
jgi:serine/threonine protein kinase